MWTHQSTSTIRIRHGPHWANWQRLSLAMIPIRSLEWSLSRRATLQPWSWGSRNFEKLRGWRLSTLDDPNTTMVNLWSCAGSGCFSYVLFPYIYRGPIIYIGLLNLFYINITTAHSKKNNSSFCAGWRPDLFVTHPRFGTIQFQLGNTMEFPQLCSFTCWAFWGRLKKT